MSQHKIYTFLLTADLGAAEAWYTELFGRGPDNRPISTLVQWELFNQAGVGIATDDEIEGWGAILLIVDAVAAEWERLRGVGIMLGEDIPAAVAELSVGLAKVSHSKVESGQAVMRLPSCHPDLLAICRKLLSASRVKYPRPTSHGPLLEISSGVEGIARL